MNFGVLRRVRVAASAGALVLGALMLAGCAGSPDTPATPSSPAPVQSPSASPSPTSSPTTTSSADPDAPADQCANDSLTVAIVEFDAGAGSIYSALRFTNTSAEACALRGIPGVSVVGDGNGTQLGAAADRNEQAAVATLQLQPGDTVSALLQSVNIASGGGPLDASCAVTTGDGYRIYPPHAFDSIFVSAPGVSACGSGVSWMTIGPVVAGADPVG